MSATRSVYKVMRSLLFTAILAVIGLMAILYILVSVPYVQRRIKERAERELTSLLGGRVSVSEVDILPFNEVRMHGVALHTPGGERCLSVGRLGAGIDLWTLLVSGEIEIVYAEIISMDARIAQSAEGAPFNIQFVIDALSGKEKKTPPPEFRVVLRNVVIRKSSVSFDRTYIPRAADSRKMDFNHISLSDFRADIEMPLISNDSVAADLRRLAFSEKCGLDVEGLSLKAGVSPRGLSFSDFRLKVGKSVITVSDQTLPISGYDDIMNSLRATPRTVTISADPLVPSDFTAFFLPLSGFGETLATDISLKGNADSATMENFMLRDRAGGLSLSLSGSVSNLSVPAALSGSLSSLEATLPASFNSRVVDLIPGVSDKVRSIVSSSGDLAISMSGAFDLAGKNARLIAALGTSAGELSVEGGTRWDDGIVSLSGLSLESDSFDLGRITGNARLGLAAFGLSGDLCLNKNITEGNIEGNVAFIDYNSTRFENLSLTAAKKEDRITAHAEAGDSRLSFSADADCSLRGEESEWNLDAVLDRIVPGVLLPGSNHGIGSVSGSVHAALSGNSPENLTGRLSLQDFDLDMASWSRFYVNEFALSAACEGNDRSYVLSSDFLKGNLTGNFKPAEMSELISCLAERILPSIIKGKKMPVVDGQYADMTLTLYPSDELYSILKLPVRPGVPLIISGRADGTDRSLSMTVDAPYLVKGRDKLIKDTRLTLSVVDSMPAEVKAQCNFPLKNDYAGLDVSVSGYDDHVDVDLGWSMCGNPDNAGCVRTGLDISRRMPDNSILLEASLSDSGFRLNGADWTVSPARIVYSGKSLAVSGLRISHGLQFVDVKGAASESPMDVITADLAGIDLEYIFNILNINHVDFGGIATGTARASSLFSGSPVARTDGLFVKDLAYNGHVLGDGDLESHWDNSRGLVAINADIAGKDSSSATVRGGVFVTRDSLSFDFHADRLDIGFLQPFMSGFTSSVSGRASGDIKLYGTFSDIDLAGKAFADTITMKVDQSNVYYSGSDTVFFAPGRITIPGIRLYDRYGNSGLLRGEVRHRFLKDPSFDFEMSGARKLLVYDTDMKMNPRWYGRVFADGSATLRGRPGLVALNINMRTASDSEFTLVLDETQTAVDYTFLTFTDHRKHLLELAEERELTFEETFRKKVSPERKERPDLFSLDMALDVTPGARMVIVMDPQAGDKIKADGRGGLQMHYDSEADELSMYGRYTLDRGDYNFSLQDLILKNFKIRHGSTISFNGDPLAGILDITAAYRVNTNLTDLDASFGSDPDLNRTSVPVDALLKVTGDIQAPEISFDISLPTVTPEVERKVRSIVSTEDMMNRQVIYLLALNRFYTPEYTGAEQGGELASVASSTLSSQLQNIVGSLTDKFSVAPSFKSEKSDLSDMEVDVALSSSLFDNRLLINGNLGYRDRSTSQTTFVGDFDLEYLLSRDGRLRLKAYNHFNDASYYLKSALTTQGVGIIYRKDFDDPFTFLKRMFRRKKKTGAEPDKTNGNKKEK
ncbi:MAG: translocation/assembly module TamB [Muribaculaceae bacterium]|nr:translocation/assembly module TamB [Muribaculaceae bacterium]